MSRTGIIAAIGCALALAVLLLVSVVLPAEYGIDPLGTGRLLGLSELGARAQQDDLGRVVSGSADNRHQEERVRFELAPFESVEHSYRMMAGDVLVFSWQADAEVVFNLHAVPDGAPGDYAVGIRDGREPGDAGAYRARFNGRHGWFWENRTERVLSIELVVAGFVSEPLTESASFSQPGTLKDAL
ncbi:MAG: hypothetical protein AAF515_23140 [Pseudomonadota bacterium]